MIRWSLFILGLGSLFGGAFNFAPKIENPESEKPMVFVIPSYNNSKFYEGNLASVFSQNYKNFRVIYTNDASTDETGTLVQEYVEKYGSHVDFTYIENDVNKGALYNICQMVEMCENDEIVLLLDGDDMLAHDDVLHRLNQAYSDEHVWMTYGSDKCRIKKNGHSKALRTNVLKNGKHRDFGFRWSHLRTFYAGLYKKVPKENWLYKEAHYPVAWDIAIVLFLMDMARDHVYFVPDVLYEYNVDSPINDFKKWGRRQYRFRQLIWKIDPLEKIESKEDFL